MPGIAANCRFDGIEVNVPENSEKVIVIFDGLAHKSGLEEMAGVLVFNVKPKGVAWTYMLEYFAKFGVARHDEQVDMIGHQAVGIELIAADFLVLAKGFEIAVIVFGVLENALLVDSADDDVIDPQRAGKATWCRHLRSPFLDVRIRNVISDLL